MKQRITETTHTSQEKPQQNQDFSLIERWELLINSSRRDKSAHLHKMTESILMYSPIYKHIFPSRETLGAKVDVVDKTISRLGDNLDEYDLIKIRNCGYNSLEYIPDPGFYGEHREYFSTIFKPVQSFTWLIKCLSKRSSESTNVHLYNSSSYSYKNLNLNTENKQPASNTRWDKDGATHIIKAYSGKIMKMLLGMGKGLSCQAMRHSIRKMSIEQLPKKLQQLCQSQKVSESHLLFMLLHVDTLRMMAIPGWVNLPLNCAVPFEDIARRFNKYLKKCLGKISSSHAKKKYALLKRCMVMAGFKYPRKVEKPPKIRHSEDVFTKRALVNEQEQCPKKDEHFAVKANELIAFLERNRGIAHA